MNNKIEQIRADYNDLIAQYEHMIEDNPDSPDCDMNRTLIEKIKEHRSELDYTTIERFNQYRSLSLTNKLKAKFFLKRNDHDENFVKLVKLSMEFTELYLKIEANEKGK